MGLDLLRSDWSEIGGWICSFAVVAKCMASPLGINRLESAFGPKSPFLLFPVGLTWCGCAGVEMGPSGLSHLTM